MKGILIWLVAICSFSAYAVTTECLDQLIQDFPIMWRDDGQHRVNMCKLNCYLHSKEGGGCQGPPDHPEVKPGTDPDAEDPAGKPMTSVVEKAKRLRQQLEAKIRNLSATDLEQRRELASLFQEQASALDSDIEFWRSWADGYRDIVIPDEKRKISNGEYPNCPEDKARQYHDENQAYARKRAAMAEELRNVKKCIETAAKIWSESAVGQ